MIWTVCVYAGLKVGVCVRGLGFRIGVIEGAIVVDGLAGGIHEGVCLTEVLAPISAGRKNSRVMLASDLADNISCVH